MVMRKFLLVIMLVLFSVVSYAGDLDTPSTLKFNEAFHNKTITETLTITNTESTNLTDITFSSTLSGSIEVLFDPEDISQLLVGESQDVDVSIRVPFSQKVEDESELGTITMDANEGSFTLSNVVADVKSYLLLDRLRITIDDTTENIKESGLTIEEEVQPLESVEIDIEVENLFDDKNNQEDEIDDVEVKVTIFGIDEDDEDLELEAGPISLDFEGNDRKHTFDIDFIVPEDAEDDTFLIEIELTGEDEAGNDIEIIWNVDLVVERQSHDLIIGQYEFSDSSIECTDNTVIDLQIVNIGADVEDYVRYTIKNEDLGINIEKSRFEIDSDPEDDENKYFESIPIKVTDAKEGTYPLELRLYRDFDLIEDASGINLNIEGCTETPVVVTPPVVVEEPEEEPASEEPKEEEKEPEASETEVTEPVEGTPSERELVNPTVTIEDSPVLTGTLVTGNNGNIFIPILIVVGSAILLAVVILIIVLLRKK